MTLIPDAPKGNKKSKVSPFEIEELTPIQLPNMDMEEFFEGRKSSAKDEWIDVLIRSSGLEPTQLNQRTKWHLLERIVPLIENNYNLSHHTWLCFRFLLWKIEALHTNKLGYINYKKHISLVY